MKRRLLLTAIPTLSVFSTTTSLLAQGAAKPMAVSSGEPAGTYYRLMKEFDEVAPGLIVNMPSDGSLTNVDRVMGNEAELGITQLDALNLRKAKETNLKDHIRILALLHTEEIHFIAKSAPRNDGISQHNRAHLKRRLPQHA